MSLNIEKIARDLHKVLKDPSIPIQANENWGSRDNSLAGGTSGILLALFEFTGDGDLKLQETDRDIFSVSFVASQPINFSSDSSSIQGVAEQVLGDVFEGYCNTVWTNLTLGREIVAETYNPRSGIVERPGIGHGDLIRDFTRWIVEDRPNKQQFSTLDISFQGGGWCNGAAGLEVIRTLVANFSDEISLRDLEAAGHKMLHWASDHSNDLEFGLCHGISGIAVSAMGIARYLHSDDLAHHAANVFNDCLHQHNLTRYPDDLWTDYSWLTGTAGVLWAHCVLNQTPLINPIIPIDSQIYITKTI